MLDVRTVAERVAKPEAEVLQQSLRAYLLREIRTIEAELAYLRERYAVLSSTDLRARITVGTIPAHPAWEDLLEWENGLAAIDDIEELLRSN